MEKLYRIQVIHRVTKQKKIISLMGGHPDHVKEDIQKNMKDYDLVKILSMRDSPQQVINRRRNKLLS